MEMSSNALRFHWSLSQAGGHLRRARRTSEMDGLPSYSSQSELCQCAETNGIESMLMAIGFTRPDPILLSCALAQETEKLKFLVACRPGLISPAYFVQQINTLSTLSNGRVTLNIVSGHTPKELRFYGDNLEHAERYARTDEFLEVCRKFWEQDGPVDFKGKYFQIEQGKLNTPFISLDRSRPEIYMGGNSENAISIAQKYADCLWRFAEAPKTLGPKIKGLVASGSEVGLLMGVIARPTREEAVEDANNLIRQLGEDARRANREFARNTDSKCIGDTCALANEADQWLTPTLWTGAIPYLGAPSIALVGDYDSVVASLMEYKALGISQFLFLGWPDKEEIERFGREILPRVRSAEAKTAEPNSKTAPQCVSTGV